MESKSIGMENLEIVYVTSLLMVHCALERRNEKILEHMFHLDDAMQVYIKNFFEIMMQYGNNITRTAVKHAIVGCGKFSCYE
jgi:hypothetical protein